MGNLPAIYANWAALHVHQNQIQQAFEIIERGRAKSFSDLLETVFSSPSKKVTMEKLSLSFQNAMVGLRYKDLVAPIPDDVTLVEYFHPGPVKIGGHVYEELWIFVITKQQIDLVKVPFQRSLLNTAMIRYHQYAVHLVNVPVSGTVLNKLFVEPVAKKVVTENLLLVPWGGHVLYAFICFLV